MRRARYDSCKLIIILHLFDFLFSFPLSILSTVPGISVHTYTFRFEMAANGNPLPGASMPELPPLDVDVALGRSDNADHSQVAKNIAAPFTPLGAPGCGPVTPGSLPLLVKMPDGERHQIELPPTATVRDLQAKLPGDSNWDLNFNGQLLRDGNSLANYNIPDAYGHAGGLLKMISDSGSNMAPTQKIEALNSACNIVASVSRGETDMERLINAALADNASNAKEPPASQPSLREVRRGKRSFMSLNLSNLPPPTLNSDRSNPAIPPPTPSQLIQKLSAQRPDLYPPSTANRMLALDAANQPKENNNGAINNGAAPPSPQHQDPDPVPGASLSALFNNKGVSPPPLPAAGNGEFKRVPTSTWFAEFVKHIAPLDSDNLRSNNGTAANGQNQNDDSIGDSEDEPDQKPVVNVGAGPPGAGNTIPPMNMNGAESVQKPSGTSTTSVSCALAAPPAGGAPQLLTMEQPRPGTSGGPSAVGSQGVQALAGTPQPKKRGRKRKNPELSEEERKALRQAQNRESAKQSRMRRKVMAAEYEKRVTTLEDENETLRDTVSALSDRLQFLQNLLTVSVQKRPPGAGL